MKKILIFLVIILFQIGFVFSQTEVSGGIYSNATWDITNSPYIVIDDIVVFPDVTLTVNPGVVIKIDDGKNISIRGCLWANGAIGDSIYFTSSSTSPTLNSWYGIQIENTLGGSANLKYCIVSYSTYGFSVECCNTGGPFNISNSNFRYNNQGISNYSGSSTPVYVDNCLFEYNQIAVRNSDKIITNSVFRNNNIGINSTRCDVSFSLFTNHSEYAIGTTGTISDCTITNNEKGVISYIDMDDGPNYLANSIISNNTIGLELNTFGLIENNIICSNDNYNVLYHNDSNHDISNNCWCLDNESDIAQTIFDGYDDISLGLLDFTPYTTDCIMNISSNNIISQPINIYPNPSDDFIRIDNMKNNAKVIIINMNGQEMYNKNNNNEQIDVSNFMNGIYIIKIIGEGSTTILKLVKE
jgi:hypothetical protein